MSTESPVTGLPFEVSVGDSVIHPAEDMSYLLGVFQRLGPFEEELARPVLLDPRFRQVPASIKYHHNYTHGLLQHTAQVVRLAQAVPDHVLPLNMKVVLFACLYHDYGKCWDYVFEEKSVVDGKEVSAHWEETPHKKNFDHIARGLMEWTRISKEYLPIDMMEHVAHCIAAHHNLKEWGSPVKPNSPESWCVHLSDMMSGMGCASKPFKC